MAYLCRLVGSCKEEMDCFSNVEVFIVIVPNSEMYMAQVNKVNFGLQL